MKWEIILVLSAALMVFALRLLPWSPRSWFAKFGTDPVLWMAQGFGLGRIRRGPGTFGSLGGLLWFALLLMTGSWWCFTLGALASIFFSVWACDRGEKILRQKDPGSIVLDEIIAMPICFFFWVWIATRRLGYLPAPNYFLFTHWPIAIGIFALFRIFDIAKPWPVSKSQDLAGGWGVTIDDVLAAIYVNLVCAAIYVVTGFLAH